MLTPQEVEERVFPKAKKGGYDMKDVDDFLDQLTADYTELYKENAVLKRKMKVLADKITEYQETEGAMRQTLLAAQKMAAQITAEAETKRASMLAEAEQIALSKSAELAAQIAEQEAQLHKLQASVAGMADNIRALLVQEEELLSTVPTVETVAVPAEETKSDAASEVAAEIGASIERMMADEAVAPAAEPVAEETPVAEEPAPVEEAAEEEAPAEEEAAEPEVPAAPVHRDDGIDDSPTRRLDLSALRFGRNYEIK